MIDDDALISATYDHWEWGEDNSGDIRQQGKARIRPVGV